MTTSEKENAVSNISKEPWLAYLDDEIATSDEDTPERDINNIMKDFLLSTSDTAATDAAQCIDAYYAEKYLPPDPLMKFEDDKGIAGFLNCIYELIFDMARLVPYDDSRQDKVVEFIIELRKLPPKSFKIWNEDCLVYTNDPVFTILMEDNWNGNYPSDDTDPAIPDAKPFKQLCDSWVNFSAFLARCIEAGILDHVDNRCKYPGFDIPKGLEEELPPGVRRDCKVMVAAQYILLAGRALYEEFVQKPAKGSEAERWGLEKWTLWTGKFEEISGGYEGKGEMVLAKVTKAAGEKMGLLHEKT